MCFCIVVMNCNGKLRQNPSNNTTYYRQKGYSWNLDFTKELGLTLNLKFLYIFFTPFLFCSKIKCCLWARSHLWNKHWYNCIQLKVWNQHEGWSTVSWRSTFRTDKKWNSLKAVKALQSSWKLCNLQKGTLPSM